jgi:hypothetical protein
MASGDFLDLQNNLAILAGRASASELDEDLALCKQVINEALLEVYRPIDRDGAPIIPEWSRRTVTLQFRAPVEITLSVTQGNRVVTGYSFPTNTAGSLVKIGTRYYRYAGLSGSDQTLVEPILEATGSYGATLYHTSQPLPADVAEIVGGVEWQGRGLLSPMTDRETDLAYRSNTLGDYKPDYGGGYFGAIFVGNTGTGYPDGDPRFYYVETDALLEGTAVIRRLSIVPMPNAAANIIMRCDVLPVELSADADRPKIIGDLVTRCLYPIAREKWGIIYKKYTGPNQSALVSEGNKARAVLLGLAKPQRRFSGRAFASVR